MKSMHVNFPWIKHLFRTTKKPLHNDRPHHSSEIREEGTTARDFTNETSFFVANLDCVARQFDLWTTYLPAVHPYYAVKCNPDPALLRLLARLGACFDCASIEEMSSVLEIGVHPKNILFANPCKAASAMIFAARAGISMTTFDNHSELDNIRAYMPDARLLLRIFANDKTAAVPLGDKYGAPCDLVESLLQRASALNLKVIGTSFHIGSGASDPEILRTAIQSSRFAWTTADSLGMSMTILDIGGGFRDDQESFVQMASAAKDAAAELGFPDDIKLIAEPGRFFARRAYSLVCEVLSVRQPAEPVNKHQPDLQQPGMLYQNDGIYTSFMNRLVEKEEYNPILIPKTATGAHAKCDSFTYSIWGPTCDSTDCISREVGFDRQIHIGDWLMYENMGAYTLTTSTKFNGFPNEREIVYIKGMERCHQSFKPQVWGKMLPLGDDRFSTLRSTILESSAHEHGQVHSSCRKFIAKYEGY